MIELGLAPCIRIMAISTLFAQFAVVGVIFRVTVIASMFCLPVLAIFFMATSTVG